MGMIGKLTVATVGSLLLDGAAAFNFSKLSSHASTAAAAASDLSGQASDLLDQVNSTAITATATDTITDAAGSIPASATAVAKEFLGNPNPQCQDILTEEESPECYNNVTWAKTFGIWSHPQYYANYTELTINSSRQDFQCALGRMVGPDEAGTGFACPIPCTSTLAACAGAADKDLPAGAPPVQAESSATTTTTSSTTEKVGATEEGSSFPWWGWLLIIGPLLCLAGAVAYYFMVLNKKEAPKKKKRATKPVKASAAPAPPVVEAASVDTTIVAPPVYVTSTRSAAPMQAPAYTAAPLVTSVQSMAIAQPVQYATAAPMASYAAAPMAQYAAAPMAQYAQYAAAPQAQFDLLDSNHDGVISRAEFAAMTQLR